MQYDALEFENSLSDAIRWCNWALANGGFQPDEHSEWLDRMEVGEWTMNFRSHVDRLIRVRHDKINRIVSTGRRAENWPGMILAFDPDDSAHDGFAQLESEGFFDVHGCPIYDFWIGITGQQRGRLLSWIPLPMKPYVDRAMDVDVFKCLAWFATKE